MIIRDHGRKHVGMFDMHVPHNIDLSPVLGYIYDHGPDKIILGGDDGHFEFASHWNDPFFKAMGTMLQKERLEEECDSLIKVYREIRKAAKKAQILKIIGNHCMWVWHAVFNYGIVPLPIKAKDIKFKTDITRLMDVAIKPLLTNLLDMNNTRIVCLANKEPLKIGRITYLHGHQFSTGPLKNATGPSWSHANVVIGHRHSHEVWPVHNQAEPHNFYEHIAVPCLCPLAPGYEKNPSTRHSHGFWVADFDSNGYFEGHIKRVINGKLIES